MFTNMENNEVFHFIGRPDGLGNRIEELINIQEFCETNNKNLNNLYEYHNHIITQHILY